MPNPIDAAVTFARSTQGVEGVIQRVGARSTLLVFVAPSGEWARAVVASPAAARTLCDGLHVPCHEGWTEDLRRRSAVWRRPPQDWARAPYPERARALRLRRARGSHADGA